MCYELLIHRLFVVCNIKFVSILRGSFRRSFCKFWDLKAWSLDFQYLWRRKVATAQWKLQRRQKDTSSVKMVISVFCWAEVLREREASANIASYSSHVYPRGSDSLSFSLPNMEYLILWFLSCVLVGISDKGSISSLCPCLFFFKHSHLFHSDCSVVDD